MQPRFTATFAWAILLACLSPADARGQSLRPITEHAGRPTSFAFGLGGSNIGLTLDVLVGYRMGAHELAGRALVGFKAAVFEGESRSLVDAGLLYGLHPLHNPRLLALRVGVSGIWYSVDRGGSTPKRVYDPVLGVPLELALTAPLGSKLGVGVTGLANLNSRRQYAGILLTLTVGGQ